MSISDLMLDLEKRKALLEKSIAEDDTGQIWLRAQDVATTARMIAKTADPEIEDPQQ